MTSFLHDGESAADDAFASASLLERAVIFYVCFLCLYASLESCIPGIKLKEKFLLGRWKQLSRLRRNDPTLVLVNFERLERADVKDVVDALRSNTHLKKLGLEDCKVGDRGAAAIADALRSNTHLETLRLLDCEVGDGGAAAIADALRANRSLKELNLSGKLIGDAGAKAIAAALSENHTLKNLILSHCRIGAAGARAIAAALSECNESGSGGRAAIAYLDLGHNAIGDDGGRALADMLRTNTTITSLNLAWCKMSDEAAKAFAVALVANDTIETLGLENNDNEDAGVKALACAALLRIRYCDVWVFVTIAISGLEEWDRALVLSQRIHRNNEDVDASDLPEAIAHIEELLPATNFLSIPHKLSAKVAKEAATLRAAATPKPGRLAIFNTAQRLLIDHILAQTRPIADAAMPIALEKIGGGSQVRQNAIDDRNGMGINALFAVCRDKPHLFKNKNEESNMHVQEQELEQQILLGNSFDKSYHVPVQVIHTKKRRGKRTVK